VAATWGACASVPFSTIALIFETEITSRSSAAAQAASRSCGRSRLQRCLAESAALGRWPLS
jgi:hypothetical protein